MTVFKGKEGATFKFLSEAISEGVIIVNTHQEIVASNGSANDMFGYKMGELTGKPLETLMPRE